MFCSKCGTKNEAGTSFCSNCGAQLGTAVKTGKKGNLFGLAFDLLGLLLNAIIAPFKGYNKEKDNMDTKNSFIFAGIVAGCMTVINLLANMITVIKVKEYDWSSFKTVTKFKFDRLGDLNYFELIFKNLLIYAAVIAVVAGVFFLGSMIIKKQITYIKSVYITAIAVIPMAITTLFAGPVLGMLWAELGTYLPVIGMVYSCIVLCGLMNEELKLEKDIKVYFYAACLSIIFIAATEILVRIAVNSALNSLL